MSNFDDHERQLTGGDRGFQIGIREAGDLFTDFHHHRTRDGQRMLIAEMEDSHLKNTLRVYVRHLETAVESLSAAGDPIQSILYDMDPEAAERYIRGFQVKFPQYVFEAAVRKMDIDGIMDSVRASLKRSERIPSRNLRIVGMDDDE